MVGYVVCLVLLCVGSLTEGNKCWNRRELIERRDLMNHATCVEPRDTLVALEVPPGYDWVYPSVVVVKQCHGHMCKQPNHQCVGLQGNKKKIKVQAYKINNGNTNVDMLCDYVTVQEHTACGCRCDKDPKECGHNEVFNKKMCRCECKPKAKEMCQERMRRVPNTVMWDQTRCSCPCNNQGECGSGTVWVPSMCKCLPMMETDEGAPMVMG
ncbi:balbiani ring protein 3-like [Homarus americanus]|uniref:balbiani ring protein 3-like n=1 Tax=Homarus americanus TaxID=6706 RepID=UPI001C47F104|nr:balbiani ring protein 3-like [Homarus americanus]